MSIIIRFPEGGAPSREELRKAADAAKAGKVVAFPTDTVYGLGSGAYSAEAARRIYALKGRASDKPLPLLAASREDADRWVKFTPGAKALAQAFWPGPLTLVLKATPEGLSLPSAWDGKLAIRVPAHPALALAISLSGGAWCSTSANVSGAPALADGADVVKAFDGKVDVILCGGKAPGVESTVVDASRKALRILREGALKEKELLAALKGHGSRGR